MLAWYFSTLDRRHGLHASRLLLDALDYAPGPFVWRVRLAGNIVQSGDKVEASEQTYLWGYDATDVLLRFARRCALDAVHLWYHPDVLAKYLQTREQNKAAAASLAAEAAHVARMGFAAGAAHVARRAVYLADDDAIAAANDAYDAAHAAAFVATRARQNRRLTAMIAVGRKEEEA
jgi:hypothetical protein